MDADGWHTQTASCGPALHAAVKVEFYDDLAHYA